MRLGIIGSTMLICASASAAGPPVGHWTETMGECSGDTFFGLTIEGPTSVIISDTDCVIKPGAWRSYVKGRYKAKAMCTSEWMRRHGEDAAPAQLDIRVNEEWITVKITDKYGIETIKYNVECDRPHPAVRAEE